LENGASGGLQGPRREPTVSSLKRLFSLGVMVSALGCGEAGPSHTPQVEKADPTNSPATGEKAPVVSTEETVGTEKSQGSEVSTEATTEGVGAESVESVPAAHHPLLDDDQFKKQAILGRLLAKKRCIICHKVEGKGGILSPPMEEVSLARLVKMKTFEEHAENLETNDPQRYESKKEIFEGILAEEDEFKRMRLWLMAYLRQPTFDNPMAKMQKQPLKSTEITQLTAYVLTVARASAEKASNSK